MPPTQRPTHRNLPHIPNISNPTTERLSTLRPQTRFKHHVRNRLPQELREPVVTGFATLALGSRNLFDLGQD